VQGGFEHRHPVHVAGLQARVANLDGDGGGADVTVLVGHRVGEHIADRAVVHRVGVGMVSGGAIGQDHQLAVEAI
ncbi:hypothetical protein CN367_12465, partial [Priestia megaterium]